MLCSRPIQYSSVEQIDSALPSLSPKALAVPTSLCQFSATQCPEKHYAPDVGQTECKPCPDARETNTPDFMGCVLDESLLTSQSSLVDSMFKDGLALYRYRRHQYRICGRLRSDAATEGRLGGQSWSDAEVSSGAEIFLTGL